MPRSDDTNLLKEPFLFEDSNIIIYSIWVFIQYIMWSWTVNNILIVSDDPVEIFCFPRSSLRLPFRGEVAGLFGPLEESQIGIGHWPNQWYLNYHSTLRPLERRGARGLLRVVYSIIYVVVYYGCICWYSDKQSSNTLPTRIENPSAKTIRREIVNRFYVESKHITAKVRL